MLEYKRLPFATPTKTMTTATTMTMTTRTLAKTLTRKKTNYDEAEETWRR